MRWREIRTVPSPLGRPRPDCGNSLGHGRSDPFVTHAEMLRLELLNVKADPERELEECVRLARA